MVEVAQTSYSIFGAIEMDGLSAVLYTVDLFIPIAARFEN